MARIPRRPWIAPVPSGRNGVHIESRDTVRSNDSSNFGHGYGANSQHHRSSIAGSCINGPPVIGGAEIGMNIRVRTSMRERMSALLRDMNNQSSV
jgi:hypothetical protein